MKQFVQGDILFIETHELASSAEKENGNVIARGEKTGHAHVIDGMGQLYFQIGYFSGAAIKRRFLAADEDITIRHEEHGPLVLPKGTYEIKEQRFYDYEAERKRVDAEKRVVD
jgi:hypothetical protein